MIIYTMEYFQDFLTNISAAGVSVDVLSDAVNILSTTVDAVVVDAVVEVVAAVEVAAVAAVVVAVAVVVPAVVEVAVVPISNLAPPRAQRRECIASLVLVCTWSPLLSIVALNLLTINEYIENLSTSLITLFVLLTTVVDGGGGGGSGLVRIVLT